MRDRNLASRYAQALLSVIVDPAQREEIAGFLRSLGSSLEASPELRVAMRDPAIPRAARKQALQALVTRQGLPAPVGRFLAMLVDRNRLPVLPAIAAVFEELRERDAGIVPADVTTAAPLSEELRRRTQEVLERVTGRRVRLSCHVEPGLLGGAVTKVGSVIYDGSLRTQLARLRGRMAEGAVTREAR